MTDPEVHQQLLSFLTMRPAVRRHLRSLLLVVFVTGIAVGFILLAVFQRLEQSQ